MKPMLARDWIEDKVKFPCLIQPKIDGVRALNIDGKLYGRSLKQLDNKNLTQMFSQQMFNGFDGEIIVGNNAVAKDLCSLTSGAVRRENDTESKFTWYVFDLVTPETINWGYDLRYELLMNIVEKLKNYFGINNVIVVPQFRVNSKAELDAIDEQFLNLGYEGSIIRNPSAVHKQGRSDAKMQVWRIKRFIDAEFMITGIIEGSHNANEAKTNELGRTERSTHQENMIPNGMVGSLEGYLLDDVKDPSSGEVILKKDSPIIVSAGTMDQFEREIYFKNPSRILNKIGKFKMFPKGVKDKPRFPVFLSIRSEKDMS